MANKDLKDAWKETGVGLGHAFRDLGKSIIKSGAYVVNKADEWANGDDNKKTDKQNQTETKPE